MGVEGTTGGMATADGNSSEFMLFLVALAASFFIQTFNPGERKVRIVFRSLAVALLAGAASWPFVSQYIPGVAASAASLASSAWAWFELLMVTLVVSSLIPIMGQRRAGQVAPPSAAVVGPPQLKPNQIIYPATKNGVLWEWTSGTGLTGPFCPKHSSRLKYKPVYGRDDEVDINEDQHLSGGGNFICSIDGEEFTFIRPGPLKVRDLKTQVIKQFQVEEERRKFSEK
jgi:hypothetical protein